MSKTIGILGGMGPMATVDFFEKIVSHTPAKTDQEHLQIMIYNNPKIPSRIQAIMEGTEPPLPELVKSARLLEAAKVDFIVVPCHTAHFWLEELQSQIKVPIYSIVEATVTYIEQHHRHLSNQILLLATDATLQKGLYQNSFQARGWHLHIPEPDEQDIISSAIVEAKASRIESNSCIGPLNSMFERYLTKGIKAVLGACTEIPLLYPYLNQNIEKLDPTLMLARTVVSLAQNDH